MQVLCSYSKSRIIQLVILGSLKNQTSEGDKREMHLRKIANVLLYVCTMSSIIICSTVLLDLPESDNNNTTDRISVGNANRRIRADRPHIEQVDDKDYEILNHYTFQDEQEQIRDEIFYGDMELLAQLIHAEAGNQELTGKRLVADVVLNRTETGFNGCDNIEQTIFYINAFSSLYDGNFDKAAWNMTEEDYLAAEMEMLASERIDSEIVYFSAEGYSKYGTPAYKYGDHYFSTR